MPHIHLLLILHKDHRITTPQEVDQYVRARIPPLPESTDESREARQQRREWYHVINCMIHTCKPSCMINGKCNKHFPKKFSSETLLSGILSNYTI